MKPNSLHNKFDELEAAVKQARDSVELSIEEAVLYEDGRGHYVYSDKSALILHPNGDCFTYFGPDGRKTR